MPLRQPKAARGSAMLTFSPSRRGTIRFSVVLIPDLSTSAKARGTAVRISGCRTEIRGTRGGCSFSRSTISADRVSRFPRQPPRITHWHARPGSFPAQRLSAPMVTAMEHSCSTTSTAARVPMRLEAVKYPVITPHRQEIGRNPANSRRAGMVRRSPIQCWAICGAKTYRHPPERPLKTML